MIEKSDIEELVLENKKSTIGTHFNDAFFTNTLKYSGEIRKNEILLWTSSHWLRGGYPIFQLKFNTENKLKGIFIKLNPFGKLIDKIMIISVIFFMISPLIVYGFIEGWKVSVIILIMASVPFLILTKASKIEKKIMIEELRKSIENIERRKYPEKFKNIPQKEEPKEKQWTVKKIITRIIFYPISILIIYFCFVVVLPNGNPLHAIFGIGICGLYLLADILNIVQK